MRLFMGNVETVSEEGTGLQLFLKNLSMTTYVHNINVYTIDAPSEVLF